MDGDGCPVVADASGCRGSVLSALFENASAATGYAVLREACSRSGDRKSVLMRTSTSRFTILLIHKYPNSQRGTVSAGDILSP